MFEKTFIVLNVLVKLPFKNVEISNHICIIFSGVTYETRCPILLCGESPGCLSRRKRSISLFQPSCGI